ncbi:hypothetical protein SAMN06298224_2180 [Fibrobacter sp. UWB16]|jgi:hypothetical protein|uniref:hypothetical protein n=1 Tax=unclassified Fibrobacter TaxID=2634177 RepID=UPI000B51EBFB|nr:MULTISPECIES: hypothetical protein [unclassified Fibrobacter]OWV15960.1 hypothetical protein B7991_14005 [Fibrobacter sp. UWB3]SOD15692.1 hypothetical protein SAMN06298224_2180 [Fibrobacter sp. UWB16]
MKKVLTVLPLAALALVGCQSSSGDSVTAPDVQPLPQNYPTDYIISELGTYNYAADGTLEITKGTCTDRANEYVWEKVTKTGSLKDAGNNSAEMDLGDGAGKNTYAFVAAYGEPFPSGSYYMTSTLNQKLIRGVILDDSYYDDVVFVNTDCLFENFGEMQETLALIAGVEKSEINMSCKVLSIQGLEMEYKSHRSMGVEYTLSYAGKVCNVKHDFRYANVETDCERAFKDYQKDYESGETTEFFNFDFYDQDINTDACDEVLEDFHNATGLAKSAPGVSKKQVKDILRAIGKRLRHGK